jgi:hypothetical protein
LFLTAPRKLLVTDSVSKCKNQQIQPGVKCNSTFISGIYPVGAHAFFFFTLTLKLTLFSLAILPPLRFSNTLSALIILYPGLEIFYYYPGTTSRRGSRLLPQA